MVLQMETDLELKKLDFFSGSENYYRCMGVLITDGVKYVAENGYAWLVIDAISKIKFDKKLRNEDFISIKLEIPKEGEAVVIFKNADGKVIKKEKYKYSNVKREFKMYYDRASNVLMLSGEY